MDNNATTERIKEILKQRNISARKMLQDLGLSQNYMVQLKAAKYVPNKLGLIAEYLGVTEDYLLNGNASPADEQIDERYIRLVNAVRGLSPEQVEAWLALLEQGGQ